jgi:hypothetical protein
MDSEQLELKISSIQNLVPTAANADRIFNLMSETFGNRCEWIMGKHDKNGGPTIALIVKKYPRFLDVPRLVSFLKYIFKECLSLDSFIENSVLYYCKFLV